MLLHRKVYRQSMPRYFVPGLFQDLTFRVEKSILHTFH